MHQEPVPPEKVGKGAVGEPRIIFVRGQAEMPELAVQSPFRIAGLQNPVAFQGRIDDLRIYNRSLTDSEILELYNEPDAQKSNSETEQTEEKQESDSSNTTAKEQPEGKQDPQAIRHGSRFLEKPKANFEKQKFFDLKGRRVRP